MSRQPRIAFPGALYHVTARAARGEAIFEQESERAHFLNLLERSVQAFDLILHAYCIMSNHYHLEVETPKGNISPAMHWLNTTYAAWFNRRRQRTGYVFQNRFYSILVERDSHLTSLTRYIHLNPPKAGLCNRPEEWPWSSYRAYVGLRTCQSWLQVDWTLAQFGDDKEQAVQEYRQFVEAGLDTHNATIFADTYRGSLLGTPDFIQSVLDRLSPDERHSFGVKTGIRLERTVSAVLDTVAAAYGLPPVALLTKTRKHGEARRVAIYLARTLTGLACAEVGRHMGGVTPAAISKACKAVRAQASRDPHLRALISDLSSNKGDGPLS